MQLSILVRNHGTVSFIPELQAFISQYKNHITLVPSGVSNHFSITHVDVWHLLKFYVQ